MVFAPRVQGGAVKRVPGGYSNRPSYAPGGKELDADTPGKGVNEGWV